MLFEASGDAPELLDLAEEALDQVAASVEFVIDGALGLDAALGRDMGLTACPADEIDDGAAVVATVGDERPSWRQSRQKIWHGGLV